MKKLTDAELGAAMLGFMEDVENELAALFPDEQERAKIGATFLRIYHRAGRDGAAQVFTRIARRAVKPRMRRGRPTADLQALAMAWDSRPEGETQYAFARRYAAETEPGKIGVAEKIRKQVGILLERRDIEEGWRSLGIGD